MTSSEPASTSAAPRPWVARPTFALDLDAPARERFAALDPELRDLGRQLLVGVLNEIPAGYLPWVRRLAYLVRLRTGDRFHRETASAARWLGVDWRELTAASVSYDLTMLAFGCSTLALPGPTGPTLARNLDWWPEALLAQASHRVELRRGGELEQLHAGWPGLPGVVTGLARSRPDGARFALAINAVSGPERPSALGYPVLLFLRRVLDDARDFRHALRLLTRARLAASCLITLVGCANEERVVIERSPTRRALRWGQPGQALITTNDYRSLFEPEQTVFHSPGGEQLGDTACGRYEALARALGPCPDGLGEDDEALLFQLSDPQVIQSITAQHVVARPQAGTLEVWVPRRLTRGAEEAG